MMGDAIVRASVGTSVGELVVIADRHLQNNEAQHVMTSHHASSRSPYFETQIAGRAIRADFVLSLYQLQTVALKQHWF